MTINSTIANISLKTLDFSMEILKFLYTPFFYTIVSCWLEEESFFPPFAPCPRPFGAPFYLGSNLLLILIPSPSQLMALPSMASQDNFPLLSLLLSLLSLVHH
jgi:hypothetical protein